MSSTPSYQSLRDARVLLHLEMLPRFDTRDLILENCWIKHLPSWSSHQSCSSACCDCIKSSSWTWSSVCPSWWGPCLRDCQDAFGFWIRDTVRIWQSPDFRDSCFQSSSFVHEKSGIHADVNEPIAPSTPGVVSVCSVRTHQYSEALLLPNNPGCHQCHKRRQELRGRILCRFHSCVTSSENNWKKTLLASKTTESDNHEQSDTSLSERHGEIRSRARNYWF